MIGEIKHPCFTFLRVLLYAIKGPDNKLVLTDYEGFRNAKKNNQENFLIINNPYYKEGDDILDNVIVFEPLDLCLSQQEYLDYMFTDRTDRIKFLDSVFLTRLKELKADQLYKFLDKQFDLFERTSNSKQYFLTYLNELLRLNPSPSNFLVIKWCKEKIEDLGVSTEGELEEIFKKEDEDCYAHSKSSRRIALFLYYLSQSQIIDRQFLISNEKNRHLEIITGFKADTLKKMFEKIKNGEFEGITSKKGIGLLIDDVKIILAHLPEKGYEQVKTGLGKYLHKLECTLESFKRNPSRSK